MKFRRGFFALLFAALLACVFFMAACSQDESKTPGGESKTVTSIVVTTAPSKTQYETGDELDLNGGVLTVYYSDGTSGTVNMTDSGVTATADMSKAGNNINVTVTYSGKTATYRISIAEPVVEYTVTFDYNYQGAPAAFEKKVQSGQTVTPPEDPKRSGYRFAGWYTEAEDGESYSFGPVTQNITLYARWADENAVTLTMKWNIEGQPENYQVQSYKKGDMTPRELPSPTLEGYRFMGWFTDEALTSEYAIGFINADMIVYAKWLKEYIFEAENTDIDDISGTGYSNARGGKELIFAGDDGIGPDMKASGGYYIAGLYVQGNELVFTINAEAAVTDAVLVLRLAAEFRNITMSPDSTATDYYTISVNGTAIDYAPITMQGTDATVIDGGQFPFEDYTITTSLSLKQGENVIRLITSNSNAYHVGTMRANAPMIDCMKIYAATTLTWTPVQNIED